MAIISKQQKVTFNLPTELKERVEAVKREFGLSFSAIYTEAIEEYVRKKERQMWRKAAQKARKEYLENDELTQFSTLDGDGVYDY
jgi:predicted transcriptional regulator